MRVWSASLNGGRPSGICCNGVLVLIRTKSRLVAELPAMTTGDALCTRLANEFPAVRLGIDGILPLWQFTQRAVKIGWICVENETVTGATAVIVRESALVVVAAGAEASVTRTVKLDVPAAVGVPLITPAALRVNPAGRVPIATAHV